MPFISYDDTQENREVTLEVKKKDSSTSMGIKITGSNLNKDFYQVLFENPSHRPIPNDTHQCYKLHISISPKQLEDSWQLLMPLFIEYSDSLQLLKITNQASVSSQLESDKQKAERVYNGAQITIYIPNSILNSPDKLLSFKNLARDINKILSLNNIKPGQQPISDAAINPYISSRHESAKRDRPYIYDSPIHEKNPFREQIDTYKNTQTNTKSMGHISPFFSKFKKTVELPADEKIGLPLTTEEELLSKFEITVTKNGNTPNFKQ